MFVPEKYCKQNCYYKGVGGEDKPHRLPVADEDGVGRLGPVAVTVHHSLSAEYAEGSSQAVGHQHEKSLRRRAHAGVGLLIDEQRAGDIVEIKGKTIDNHRKDDGPQSGARVADAEQSEAQNPCQHCHKHHIFYAETTQEERYQQNTYRLGNL